MALYLIRHAQAGRRDSWHGPDDLRPLNALGRAQAEGIAAWLGDVPVAQILSSPSVRCVETVQPLAAQRGLAVQVTDFLSPSGALQSALDLVRTVPDHSVLCSHGELIPQVMEVLTRQGATLVGPADWRKGSTWVLERDAGRVVRTYAVPAVRQLGVVGG